MQIYHNGTGRDPWPCYNLADIFLVTFLMKRKLFGQLNCTFLSFNLSPELLVRLIWNLTQWGGREPYNYSPPPSRGILTANVTASSLSCVPQAVTALELISNLTGGQH